MIEFENMNAEDAYKHVEKILSDAVVETGLIRKTVSKNYLDNIPDENYKHVLEYPHQHRELVNDLRKYLSERSAVIDCLENERDKCRDFFERTN